jgi:dihydrodipicolinate synthase/N-acetylneuraminate lyase
MIRKMHGVVTAMITPLDKSGRIDEGALGDYIEFLIAGRVHALYPLGTTGEMLHLTMQERKDLAQAVVRKAAGRITVFIHTGAARMEETIELSKHAVQIGADGIGVVTPFYLPLTSREMESFYTSVAASVGLDFPVYLYNIPQCAANDLTPESAAAIASRCPNVVGIKYSYPNVIRTLEYLAINQGSFSVLCGPDSVLQAMLGLGCDGIVTGLAGVYPELLAAAYDCYLQVDRPKAKSIQFLIYKVGNMLRNGSNMAFFKKALEFRGIAAGHMRAPQLDLTAAESAELARQMRELQPEIDALIKA